MYCNSFVQVVMQKLLSNNSKRTVYSEAMRLLQRAPKIYQWLYMKWWHVSCHIGAVSRQSKLVKLKVKNSLKWKFTLSRKILLDWFYLISNIWYIAPFTRINKRNSFTRSVIMLFNYYHLYPKVPQWLYVFFYTPHSHWKKTK